MSTSSFASAARSLASLSGAVALPIAGPTPPTFDVVKKTGSMRSKSPSARMRSIRTEPTIPRQPMNPVLVMIVFSRLLERGGHRRAHLLRADRPGSRRRDVGGAQSFRERSAHGLLDPRRDVRALARVAEHHPHRE